MAEESDLERTEAPTGRRLEQAREKGQVPHSRELGSFLVLIVAAGIFWFMGSWFLQQLIQLFHQAFTWDPVLLKEPRRGLTWFMELSANGLLIFAPLVLALMVAALASPFLLNAWNFAPKAFSPISPASIPSLVWAGFFPSMASWKWGRPCSRRR